MKTLFAFFILLLALPTLAQETVSTPDGSMSAILPAGFSLNGGALLTLQLIDEASFSTFQVFAGQALYDSLDGNLRPQDIMAYYENSFSVIMDAEADPELSGTFEDKGQTIEQLMVVVPNDGGIISVTAMLSAEGVPLAVLGLIPTGTDNLAELLTDVRQLLTSITISPEVPPALLLALSADDALRFADGRVDPTALDAGQLLFQSGTGFSYDAESFAFNGNDPISDSVTLFDETRKIALRVTELSDPTNGLDRIVTLLTEASVDYTQETQDLDIGILKLLFASPVENGAQLELISAQITLAEKHTLYIEMVAYETADMEAMKAEIIMLVESISFDAIEMEATPEATIEG